MHGKITRLLAVYKSVRHEFTLVRLRLKEVVVTVGIEPDNVCIIGTATFGKENGPTLVSVETFS